MKSIVLLAMMATVLLSLELDAAYAQGEIMDGSLDKLKELSGFAEWPGKTGPVRASVRFSKDQIPVLERTTEVWPNKRPVLWEIEGGYVVRHRSRWQTGPEDFVDVVITVAESCEDAHEYLIERCFYTSLPFELRICHPDQPAVAGDISFAGGRKFIQNNLVVEIRAEGEMREKVDEIAKQIDVLLLNQPTMGSSTDFKPITEKVELIIRGPVRPGSSTKLVTEVIDPLGGALDYRWQLSGGEGSGIVKEGDEYYYRAGEVGTFTLTLTVISESGFFSSAQLEIKVAENDIFKHLRSR